MGGEVTRPRRPWHPSVLLVDDNTEFRALLAAWLESAGYRVETVSDGVLALQRVHDQPYDMLVCDFAMIGLDGVSFYRALIRARPELQSRFILLTGYASHPKVQALLAETDVPVVTKPCSLSALHQVIEDTLSLPPP